jgi:hypothetical protein
MLNTACDWFLSQSSPYHPGLCRKIHANVVIASTFRPSTGHPSFRFSSTKQLYVLLLSPMRATCPVHLIILCYNRIRIRHKNHDTTHYAIFNILYNHIKANLERRNSDKILYADDKWLGFPHNYCNQFHYSLVSRYDNTSLSLQLLFIPRWNKTLRNCIAYSSRPAWTNYTKI